MAKLGDLLVQKNVITANQLNQALAESKRTGELLGKTLQKLGFVTEEKIISVLGEQLGLPFYKDLSQVEVDDQVIKKVPARFVWHYKFMPLGLENNVLTIAVSDPLAVWPMEDLKLHLGFEVERVLATSQQILSALGRYYGVGSDTIEEIIKQDKSSKQDSHISVATDIEDLEKKASDASVIKLVNEILSEAINLEATDIHFEKYRDHVRVRYRIDGVLHEIKLPADVKYLYPAIVSRIKIFSNLDVIERRLPQDGRAIVKVQGKQVDLRISIIPSLYGENVVIRILPTGLIFNLEDLGFFSENLKDIEDLLTRTSGITFLTGPTGSGKTTTLYAFLSFLNKEEVKIISIEDPAEYEMKGIFQIQVKPEIGLTFASSLRSILRHDPDIIMIGEVRDLDTAELAIRTSLTGHLIFSTLHTNDAVGGITRLQDIGIESYLIASSVNAFISQRLVRKICPLCKEEIKDTTMYKPEFGEGKLYQGKGCKECSFTGYKGRTTIYEIFNITDDVRELIMRKASSAEIHKAACDAGFKEIKQVGVKKALAGLTSPQEVLRVISM